MHHKHFMDSYVLIMSFCRPLVVLLGCHNRHCPLNYCPAPPTHSTLDGNHDRHRLELRVVFANISYHNKDVSSSTKCFCCVKMIESFSPPYSVHHCHQDQHGPDGPRCRHQWHKSKRSGNLDRALSISLNIDLLTWVLLNLLVKE